MYQTSPREAEELRAETSYLLKKNVHHPNPASDKMNIGQSGSSKKFNSESYLQQTRGLPWL